MEVAAVVEIMQLQLQERLVLVVVDQNPQGPVDQRQQDKEMPAALVPKEETLVVAAAVPVVLVKMVDQHQLVLAVMA